MEQERTRASEHRSGNTVDDTATNRTTRTTNNEPGTSTGSLAEGASHAQMYGTTQAGLPRRRIKWTQQMKESLIRAYFMATRNGQEMVGYRQRMHEIFITEFPELRNISEQNLADHRSAIVRKNQIPQTIISELQAQVANQLEESRPSTQPIETVPVPLLERETEDQLSENPSNDPISEQIEHRENTDQHVEDEPLAERIQLEYNRAKELYEDMNPCLRPSIPKLKTNKHTRTAIRIMNKIITDNIEQVNSFGDIVSTLYCSAMALVIANDQKAPIEQRNGPRERKQPKWVHRIEKKILEIRGDLGVITSYKNGNNNKRNQNKVNKIKRKYKVHARFETDNKTIEEFLDTLAQKLNKYVDRLKRYKKSYKRKTDNKQFKNNEQQFYKSLCTKENQQMTNNNNTISMKTIEEFWRNIWGKNTTHNDKASWIGKIEHESQNIQPMTVHTVTMEELKQVIYKIQNWKQPGPDRIHNFWIKKLTSLHSKILSFINIFIECPEQIPTYLSIGCTYLKEKESNTMDPAKFRPITCLNTLYKILTSSIAKIINEHCNQNNIISEQQKGNKAGSYGCKEQLLIDSVILNQATQKQKNMYAAFIDYQKAYDSVPHSWLIQVLKIYKINPIVIKCLENMTEKWKTTLHLTINGQTQTSKEIEIKRGIFQGDSLSPLWFCIAINPLSTLLDNSNYGYTIKGSNNEHHIISHNLYMDDLKLYTNRKQDLNKLLKVTEIFSDDIKMNFGIEKCKTQDIYRGRLKYTQGYQTSDNQLIQPLKENETYKYLGIMQNMKIDHTTVKNALTNEFEKRLTLVAKTGLNSKNMTKAINTYAIPLLTYSFGIIKWSNTDLESLDRKIRVLLTKYKYHHPHSAVERVNISRDKGGRGIINITNLCSKQIAKINEYFNKKATLSELHKTIVQADDNLTPINMRNYNQPQILTVNDYLQKWKQKPLHGKYPNLVTAENIDNGKTNSWLKGGTLFPETEGHIIAIQDRTIATKNYLKYIVHDPTIVDDKCRKCNQTSETIDHILNGCSNLSQIQYKNRHDILGKIIHNNICLKLKLVENITPHYKYNPERILENERYKVYWDRSILMDPGHSTEPIGNRPDMIVFDKYEKTAKIVDFAIPLDRNIEETYRTKMQKYQQLAQYVNRSYKLKKTEVIPVIISSTGTVPKTTTRAIETLNLNNYIVDIAQKNIIIKTCSIVREFLNQ